jgi:hypothetical protein
MKNLLSISVLTLAISGVAFAQNNQSQSSDQTKQQNEATGQMNQSQQDMGPGTPAEPKPRKDYAYSQQADKDMEMYDTDKDQRISEKEAASNPDLVARWADFDVNGDGSVDVAEYHLFAAHRHTEELQIEKTTKRDSDEMGAEAAKMETEEPNKPDSQTQTKQ